MASLTLAEVVTETMVVLMALNQIPSLVNSRLFPGEIRVKNHSGSDIAQRNQISQARA